MLDIYAQSSLSIAGTNVNRSHLKLDESELVNQLKSLALNLSAGAQLLRIYWYDGAKNGMTVEQLILADMQDVKVRLGSINSAGQQKGVDSLLVTDLIDLARNQAISDALIVTGDGDMRVAVQIAQSFGVRVHLIGLEPSRASQSSLLRQEADTVYEISKADVSKFMRHSAPSLPPAELPDSAAGSPATPTSFGSVVTRSLKTILAAVQSDDMAQLKAVIISSGRIPGQYDGRILGTCRALLGRDLNGAERRAMRNAAIDFIKGTNNPGS